MRERSADGYGPWRGRFGSLRLSDQVRLLAPGVISTENTDDLHVAFTPDERTLYFTRRVPRGRFTIMVSELGPDGGWSEPRVAAFSGRWADQEPFLSPDGRRLYFTSNRPLSGDEAIEGREAWLVEREGSGWGTPRRLEAPIRVPRSAASPNWSCPETVDT